MFLSLQSVPLRTCSCQCKAFLSLQARCSYLYKELMSEQGVRIGTRCSIEHSVFMSVCEVFMLFQGVQISTRQYKALHCTDFRRKDESNERCFCLFVCMSALTYLITFKIEESLYSSRSSSAAAAAAVVVAVVVVVVVVVVVETAVVVEAAAAVAVVLQGVQVVVVV